MLLHPPPLTSSLLRMYHPRPVYVIKFQHLANQLSSVGQLCDSNMLVLFDANYIYIFNWTRKEILCGQCHPLMKLYMIPLLRDITTTNVQRVSHGSNLAERMLHVSGSINIPPATYLSCTLQKIRHLDTVHVRFHIDSIYNNKPCCPFIGKFYKGQSKPLAALNVCNKLLDCAPTAVVNSGTSHNFATVDYNGGKHQEVQNGIQVCVANQDIITSTATDEFPFANVTTNARICHKFPHLTNNLLSFGQMCDSNMLVLFDAN